MGIMQMQPGHVIRCYVCRACSMQILSTPATSPDILSPSGMGMMMLPGGALPTTGRNSIFDFHPSFGALPPPSDPLLRLRSYLGGASAASAAAAAPADGFGFEERASLTRMLPRTSSASRSHPNADAVTAATTTPTRPPVAIGSAGVSTQAPAAMPVGRDAATAARSVPVSAESRSPGAR